MLQRVPVEDEGLQIRFWGTRGSVSTSGPEFAEFGGHTPCVEVRCGKRPFIIDAGSGLSALGSAWGDSTPREVDILLSHLHLDHVGGLPFFKPAVLGADRVIRTYCGHLDGASAEEALGRLYSPPLFPITLADFPARFEHVGFRAGETLRFEDGITVDTHLLNHPGGATGYRFRHRGRVLCYISDLEHSDPWPDPGLSDFVEGADLIVYDGMFSDVEYTCCRGWGHSTWNKGVELCRAARVKAMAVFHHCPQHNDVDLRAIEAELQAQMPTAFVARERQAITFAPVI